MSFQLTLVIAFTTLTPFVSSAATLYVGARNGSCLGGYPTITAAVTAANPGDTVYVCTGVYPEQVTITKHLTLAGQSGATIQPTTASINVSDGTSSAIVYVEGVNATVSGFIIDGSLAFSGLTNCSEDVLGIYYSNASGTIVHNAVRYIEQSASGFGCQVGLGIFADNPGGAANTVVIEANSVHDFQKNGITVHDTGLTGTVVGNTVLGIGPTPLIAQNGIEFAYGSTGSVTDNNASGFVYTPCVSTTNCSYSSTGVLIYDSTGVTMSGNTLGQSQGAIFVYVADDMNNPLPGNCTITKNAVSDTLVFDGIGVQATTNTIGGSSTAGNTVVNSGESGIALYASGNTVSYDTIIEAPVGVLMTVANPTPTGDKYIDVVTAVQNSLPGTECQCSPSGPALPSPVRFRCGICGSG